VTCLRLAVRTTYGSIDESEGASNCGLRFCEVLCNFCRRRIKWGTSLATASTERNTESEMGQNAHIMPEKVNHLPQGPARIVSWVWGLPLAPFTLAETVEAVARLVEARQPSFFITAPTHYAMLTEEHADLRAINTQAAFIVADGAPLVWASRLHSSPLPERVAGSDLIFELNAEAAKKGYRVFLLGGTAGVAADAARRLTERYQGLQVVGTDCPPFREPTEEEQTALLAHIRLARPDILFVAFGQPKGERWIVRHLVELGVPVSVQVGASLDFAAGRIRRAPRWMQKSGLEWAFRLWLEPRRLFARYASNAWFIVRMVAYDLWCTVNPLHAIPEASVTDPHGLEEKLTR
jgi:N-acetylglucosaminyldiphosphoundecaprenol N-acetyl-beta-D-mannosaminyltransferase